MWAGKAAYSNSEHFSLACLVVCPVHGCLVQEKNSSPVRNCLFHTDSFKVALAILNNREVADTDLEFNPLVSSQWLSCYCCAVFSNQIPWPFTVFVAQSLGLMNVLVSRAPMS